MATLKFMPDGSVKLLAELDAGATAYLIGIGRYDLVREEHGTAWVELPLLSSEENRPICTDSPSRCKATCPWYPRDGDIYCDLSGRMCEGL